MERVVEAVKRSRAGFREPDKPVASLLFVGPTGVGKTELARQLAATLGVPLLRYDMSEYQEKHTVAKFVGAPPGYVGYEEGGLLTEAIRKNPHAVLLLDEIEKAHEDIFNTLLQVMDYATLTDNNGKKADFRNVVLLMTSNAGAREIGRQTIGFEGLPIKRDAVYKALERTFSPEFRNRLDGVVNFHGLTEEVVLKIVKKAVADFAAQLIGKKVLLTVTDGCYDVARPEGLLPRIRGARDRPARSRTRSSGSSWTRSSSAASGRAATPWPTSKTTTWSSGSPMPVYRLPEAVVFPPVDHAAKSGLLAVGGDLSPERLLAAYREGIFPWYGDGEPILWWSPDPRFVLFPDELRVSRSMRQFLKKGIVRITFDQAFREVIAACRKPRPGQDGTWITAEMREAYGALHDLGFAHSVEVWQEERTRRRPLRRLPRPRLLRRIDVLRGPERLQGGPHHPGPASPGAGLRSHRLPGRNRPSRRPWRPPHPPPRVLRPSETIAPPRDPPGNWGELFTRQYFYPLPIPDRKQFPPQRENNESCRDMERMTAISGQKDGTFYLFV